jgi:predicted AlkP superfamily pyrophosphatase or phosphodiesterase
MSLRNTERQLNSTKGILILALLLALSPQVSAQPRLVLQITVDGLRGDLLERYSANLGEGGFNYLLTRGTVYTNAHYLHANTETIVGHTTLATGATPAVHGMVGNVWYYADTGELGYNIEDPDAPIIPTREDAVEGAQVDPAQLRATSSGRSPRGILAPTFSDTLKVASGGKAKVFGISGKDRSAVALAGRTGIAYWYSTDTGEFVSSAYYMNEYPRWVRAWNEQGLAEALDGRQWTLLLDRSRYLLADQDDRPYEVDLKGYGRTFPHAFGSAKHPLFFTRLIVSPEGDRLLLDFGKKLIRAEEVGQDDVTDYLSMSFSAVDAVNHFFGPSSLENEDTVLQLDRTLADLFRFIDKEIGLDKTLIVLAADHGMAEMPEYATELGHDAGRIYGDEVLSSARELSAKLYDHPELVKDFFRPYLYLDRAALDEKGLDRGTVAAAIAEGLARMPGIAGAVPSHTLGKQVGTPQTRAIRHNHHERRSGDVYVFQQPYWFLYDRGPIGVMHGSPWAYDTHVNIIFAGPGIGAAKVHRLVHPVDVAPTLSALLGLSPPAAAEGEVLLEVMGSRGAGQ